MGKPSRPPRNNDDLGLPDDFDQKHIPTPQNLRDSAVEALHREVSFVMVNAKEDPQAIIGRLDELYAVIQAAGQIDGSHLPRTIRLALTLRGYFWRSVDRRDAWGKLIVPLITKSMEIGDRELESEIYRTWSIHLFSSRKEEGARQALLAALEVADTTGREDIKLLVAAERFHRDIATMSLDEARATGCRLSADAWRLRYTYVLARVYLSLAWKCRELLLREDAFNYAQQGFAVAATLDDPVLAGECIDGMLTSLNSSDFANRVYFKQLQGRLEYETQRSGSELFRGVMSYNLAVRFYYQGDYDRSREMVLRAWGAYRRELLPNSAVRVRHMLGLIQTKRRRFAVADRHLRHVLKYYKRIEDLPYTVHALHAHAHIAIEQGLFEQGRNELLEAQRLAKTIPEAKVRENILAILDDSFDEIDAQSSES
jgi:hypothetical protein